MAEVRSLNFLGLKSIAGLSLRIFRNPLLWSSSFLLLNSAYADWHGSGSLSSYYDKLGFPSTDKFSTTSAGPEVELKLDWKGDWARLKSHFRARGDLATEEPKSQWFFDPKQFYLELGRSIRLRLGYQTWILDGPDLINPADIVHGKNWARPTKPDSLASAGISFSQEVGSWMWELFCIPIQTKSIYPRQDSPWWPREKRLALDTENSEFRLPSDIEYHYGPEIELDHATLKNVALRIQNRSTWVESQLVVYEGLAHDPYVLTDLTVTTLELQPKQIFLVESPVVLVPLLYRQLASALTFTVPISTWILRAAASQSKPEGDDERIPGPSSNAVVGLEKSIEYRGGLIVAILQHVWQSSQNKSQVSFLRSVFESAWTVGFRIPFGEETQALVGGVFDDIGKSSIYELRLERRLSNHWSVALNGEWLNGPESTLVGLYKRYDSYGASLSLNF